jgi:radical SAM superfamily enzyme YgiQ (UPF0313 family)
VTAIAPLRIDDWIVSAREWSTCVSPDRVTVYSFDREGRPLSWFERGRVYKRSLASDVHGRERVTGAKRRFKLTRAEAIERFEIMRERIARASSIGLDGEAADRIEKILAWTPERLLDERARFDSAYRPVTILPPDQYLAVVLQATFGCSWRRCTFCDFYDEQPFAVRSVEEFRGHVAEVRALLGRAAGLRRSIFLGSGNALLLPNSRLRPLLRVALEAFPSRSWSGFVDVFTGQRKSRSEWEELRERGLARVHLGLETGDDSLLAWLNKPGTRELAIELVSTLKRAGVRVAVILMVGVGGRKFAAEHVRSSLEMVARLPLDGGDIVYLSPFVESRGSAYASRAADEGIRPLPAALCERQYRRLREGIREMHPEPRTTRYDIREFVY